MTPTADYLIIETRDPFGRTGVGGSDPLVHALTEGATTTVVLAQNAVLGARRESSAAAGLTRLAARARVLADDFSLRERGIGADELAPGVAVTTMDELVELITVPGCKVLWH